MGHKFTRRFIISALMASAADVALAKPPVASIYPPARPDDFNKRAVHLADDLIAKAGLGGKISYVVADVETGVILEVKNPVLKQIPASVIKIITTLYALDNLGPNFRFKTRLMATGPVNNGRLMGDLVLVGGGDPTLDTDDMADMAAELKQAGVREISGAFRVNINALPFLAVVDPSQPDHVGYNPTVSALNLNYNRVHFEWHRRQDRYDISMDARTKKYRPNVRIASMQVVDRTHPLFTYKDAGEYDHWTVARPALGQRGARWLPVRKPHLYAAEVFQTMARSHGINLPRATLIGGATKGTVLVEKKSERLQVLLQGLLSYSNNLTAETIGLTTSNKRGVSNLSLQSSTQEMADWMSVQSSGRKSSFVDHSGLGQGSRLSAVDTVSALLHQGLSGMLKLIPMLDAMGRIHKDHPTKIHAKTGTLNFVSALAGYVRGDEGRKLAFAIYIADEPRRDKLTKSQREAPPGAREWDKSARRLQQALIERWVTLYGE